MLKGLFVALAAATAAVAVQGRPDSRAIVLDESPDAGRTPSETSGSLHDAGLRVIVSPDGGPTYLGDPPGQLLTPDDPPAERESAAAGENERPGPGLLTGELQQLRGRVAALEQQLAQSRADSQTDLLETLNAQVAALRGQLARDQARSEAAAVMVDQARVGTQEAVVALSVARRQLAFGNSEVLDALDSAYPALPFPAQGAVENARRAIHREDLSAARYWLSVAIGEAQGTQLGY